jgi:AraC-like DNA-binding protein
VGESHSYPQWKGFERSPEGLLLRQYVELDGQMGIAYERSVGFFKDMHTHSRLMLVAPRGACRMDVRTPEPVEEYPVDARTVLLVPAGLNHDDLGTSVVYDTMALYPSEDFLAVIAAECGLSSEQVTSLAGEMRTLRRSPWLDDILERYFCERVLGCAAADGSQELLEKQIMHEVVRIVFELDIDQPQESLPSSAGDTVGRALMFIEGNLFEPLDIGRVCAAARVSESTLLRAFKREVGQTPSAYVRQRRLDEAARLLGAGDHKVGDVALLIGYEDIGAFARAFKDRFGVAPSGFGRDQRDQ